MEQTQNQVVATSCWFESGQGHQAKFNDALTVMRFRCAGLSRPPHRYSRQCRGKHTETPYKNAHVFCFRACQAVRKINRPRRRKISKACEATWERALTPCWRGHWAMGRCKWALTLTTG